MEAPRDHAGHGVAICAGIGVMIQPMISGVVFTSGAGIIALRADEWA